MRGALRGRIVCARACGFYKGRQVINVEAHRLNFCKRAQFGNKFQLRSLLF